MMARAEKLAPEDSEIPFVLTLLRTTEADALQHEGKPTADARRAAIESGRRALQMHAGRGTLLRPIVAQQLMWLGKDAWMAGEDPRPHFAAGRKAFEEAFQAMPGQPAPIGQFANSVDMEAGILLALGEDPCPKLESVVTQLQEILEKTPGLGYLEGIAAELLVDEALFRSEQGGDPTPILARLAPLLDRAEPSSAHEMYIVVARAAAWIAQARWDTSRGTDPSAILARAEKHIGTLGKGASADLPQEFLARIALERARWLGRSGRAAGAAAEEGIQYLRVPFETRPRDPDLWVLKAQLQALGGDRAAAQESLGRAWAINPLIKGGPGSRAAEAMLAAR
jgi:hypothetical protein